MASKRYYEEKKQERKDGGMLSEDKGAVANLPQDVKYHAWPTAGHYIDGNLDDTITGIDRQIDEDGRDAKKELDPHKW